MSRQAHTALPTSTNYRACLAFIVSHRHRCQKITMNIVKYACLKWPNFQSRLSTTATCWPTSCTSWSSAASPTTGSGISVSCLIQVISWHPEQVYTELIRLIKAVQLYRKFNYSAMAIIYFLGTQWYTRRHYQMTGWQMLIRNQAGQLYVQY